MPIFSNIILYTILWGCLNHIDASIKLNCFHLNFKKNNIQCTVHHHTSSSWSDDEQVHNKYQQPATTPKGFVTSCHECTKSYYWTALLLYRIESNDDDNTQVKVLCRNVVAWLTANVDTPFYLIVVGHFASILYLKRKFQCILRTWCLMPILRSIWCCQLI